MDIIDRFEEQVKQELEGLSKEDIVYFAWLCAVRALPYLGEKGHFNFWKEEDRQGHLYAIFYVLDISIASTSTLPFFSSFSSTFVHDAERATADVAYAKGETSYYASKIAVAADAAAIAASTAVNADISKITNIINNIVSIDRRFITIILQDIKSIKDNTSILNTDISFYGKVWEEFQQILKKEECSYWGELYEEIFKKGLKPSDESKLRNRLTVPYDTRKQGAKSVGVYLRNIEDGSERLNEARIIILGEKGSGKTSLARRLINANAVMTEKNESTPGVDTNYWKLLEENINVRIWDFAGHVVTHAGHKFFLSDQCLYILVYDGRTEERNKLEYWLRHVKMYGKESKIIILINQYDKHTPRIPINTFREEYNIAGFHIFSIKDDTQKLEEFSQDVVKCIQENLLWKKEEIPQIHYKIKEELEKQFIDEKKEHITKEEFENLVSKYGVSKDHELQLLQELNNLGVCLWYKDIEELDTLVLNPEWISQGVYKIINWTNENSHNSYEISLKDFEVVFKDESSRYKEQKHLFLFDLMKNYKLAYETRDNSLIYKGTCKDKKLLIPHLLPEDRPETLPEFSIDESLALRYETKQLLPPHTISRFIVEHNEDIHKENSKCLFWRYGAVLKNKDGDIALVREDKKGKTITVSIKGKTKTKTKYLGKLRKTLNEIFEGHHSEYELVYRVTQYGSESEVWFSGGDILYHQKNNIPRYDPRFPQPVDMSKLVKEYNITEDVLTKGERDIISQRTENIFNFQNCNITLQGNLNDLAGSLRKADNIEDARVLEEAADALSQAEQYKTPDEVKRKGILNKLKRIIDDLNDEDSELSKTVNRIKKGIDIAQDIAAGYNDIAQWVGLPRETRSLLKDKREKEI